MKQAPIKVSNCAFCGAAIPRGRLMCPAHWRQVPKPLQVAVWRAWKAYEGRRTPAEGLVHLKAYREATDAACAALQDRQMSGLTEEIRSTAQGAVNGQHSN